jgi:S-adenosylmethionine:tRNA ribosyltransferase-isomerase
MTLDDFDYHLPEELIAQRPLERRDASRLLWLNRRTGQTDHRSFADAPDILAPGDLLVFNDTRVTALRIHGNKPSGAKVEALVLRPEGKAHLAMVRPARKLRPGETVDFEDRLSASVVEDRGNGLKLLRFHADDPDAVLMEIGQTPLPPYIHERLDDPGRYQTVYARRPGSAAAPTAGLHFTEELLGRLRSKGVLTATVTLDVGIDTFRPVGSIDLAKHKMHGERCAVPEETARLIADRAGRVVAVGTTTVRTLETFATGPRQVEPGERVSDLFIRPGHEFQVVDGMFTNFHLPKTTMLMMVAALAGREPVLKAYEEAVALQYRFLSFGDAMLVL